MFAGEPRKDIHIAFRSILDVFDDVSKQSLDGRQYYDTLKDLSHSVAKYRERVATEIRTTVDDHVEHFLVIDSSRVRVRESVNVDPSQIDLSGIAANMGIYDLNQTDYFHSLHFETPGNGSLDAEDLVADFETPNLAEELEEFERLFWTLA